jgi:hypothetical protein
VEATGFLRNAQLKMYDFNDVVKLQIQPQTWVSYFNTLKTNLLTFTRLYNVMCSLYQTSPGNFIAVNKKKTHLVIYLFNKKCNSTEEFSKLKKNRLLTISKSNSITIYPK